MSRHSLPSQPETAFSYKLLKVTSEAFVDNGIIPDKYGRDVDNVSPPLQIDLVPEGASCLALFMDDSDAFVSPCTHWLAWNIPITHHISENDLHGVVGLNDFNQRCYVGPFPRWGTHRYVFRIYALDTILDIPSHTRRFRLEKEISDHILAFGHLTGLYKNNTERR